MGLDGGPPRTANNIPDSSAGQNHFDQHKIWKNLAFHFFALVVLNFRDDSVGTRILLDQILELAIFHGLFKI